MGLDQYLQDKDGNELIYWRKANMIHSWFERKVGKVENCERLDVSIEQLKQLKEDCLTVLNDHSKAKELLPTTSGFFFGSTEYDDWYFQDLEFTVKSLDKLFDDYDEKDDGQLAYFAWW